MFKDKRMRILAIVMGVIVAIVAFRVGMNIVEKNAKAKNSGGGKSAVVTAGNPVRQTITPKYKFSGTLEPVWQADVAAKVDGRIEQVLVDEGDKVSAGQALVILEQTDTNANLMQARGSYIDAQATVEKAQHDYDRAKYLFEKGAISEEELEHAQFALDNALGKLANAEGSVAAADSKVGGTTVTTPRAGIVQKRYYQEGYYAKVGTALFNIADISVLRAKIDVPEGFISSIAVGGRVECVIPSMDNLRVVGTITRISPVAVQPSRTFEAEVTVNNADGKLRGGIYADAILTALPKTNVLTVPLSAIVMRDDQRTVYVVEDGIAVRKVLKTGYIGDDIVEVLDGVTEQDVIITGGLNKVREGSKVKISERGAEEK
ncbi:efflux RND transporter periplasmic adaptor subunit [Schwartzia succinivorans]|jgi:RND family efflux transporter MFP subunit|uniref:RND family efflux transporter, MFP subunit n=1 Tax=Schwartzia succinivorans DSM 10502 TaxID=1123243 RepID=A0A1M4X8B8_9FIRM|nr:efflux RND transporter periplasmic adaptor subunit [Schwartzia succinivorans]SHE89706.1 RND family efflux transporter, MFP subunit [Schwartzia succinivorans DSM 10502]